MTTAFLVLVVAFLVSAAVRRAVILYSRPQVASMSEYFPPDPYELDHRPTVFLAGSIAMGTAADWRSRIRELLSHHDVVLLNPLRKVWDTSWAQSASNTDFSTQVTWEMDGLDKCDFVLMYFDPTTTSPITLLELGLYASKPMAVCCPDGFWRKGNVEMVCRKFGIPMVETLDDLATECISRMRMKRTDLLK